MPGTGDQEGVLLVQSERGTTIVLNDRIFDLANRPGLSGRLFKVLTNAESRSRSVTG